MTENEAIFCIKAESESHSEICDECELYGKTGCDHCHNDAIELAIKALEEVQQYRSSGAPEECRAAMEKQIARKTLHHGCYDKDGVWHEWNGINDRPYELCPNCRVNLCCEMPGDVKPKYCKECGQKLDWKMRNT